MLGFIKLTAQPIINSFAPINGAAGTTVIISGTGFNSINTNNIVCFGAVKANITAASNNSLTVTVPVSASLAPITVLNTVTGLTASSAQFFYPTFAPNTGNITSGDMAAKVDFVTGNNPYAEAIGDLDGDGKPDIVIVNFSSNTISVLQNRSVSGVINVNSFVPKIDFNAGSNPYAVAIGDLDGDGKPDIVVANYSSNTVSVFHNKSVTGTIDLNSFDNKIDFVTGTSPVSISIGDIDGDGKPDIVVANHNSNTISILQNNCNTGSITQNSFASKIDFTAGLLPFSIALGDMDGDGRLDIITANGSGNSISIFRNQSNAGAITSNSLAGKVDFATALVPYSVAVADLDGDGKLDIAVANEGSNTVSVFRNTSSAGVINANSFAVKVDFKTSFLPFSVAIGDIDGDGKPDLVVTNEDSAYVSIYRNKTVSGNINTNSFANRVDFKTGAAPYAVAIGDMDGDSKPDLVVVNYNENTVSVLRNIPTFPPVSLSYTTPDVYTKNISITSLNPTVTGGTIAKYIISPALPTGLNLDAATGIISGTPTVLSNATDYTINGSNAAGSVTSIINITVNDVAPIIKYTTPNIFIRGKSITSLSPVTSGGTVINYAISPALPTGLNLDAATGIISGTPIVLSAATNYTVTATNSGGIGVAILNITVIKIPDPVITSSGSTAVCEGNSVILTSSETTGNQWYKNGMIINGATAQSYIATVAGIYTVIVSNSFGDVTNPSNAITVTVNPIPVVKFSMPSVICLPDGKAQFNNASTILDNSILNYNWSFGDGNNVSQTNIANPIHTYSAVGPFTVQLKVTSAFNCTDSLSQVLNTIYPQPHADFSFAKDSICLNDTVQFINQSSNSSVTNWYWDLANGNTSSSQNPVKTFIDSGSFTISLYFYNQQGCISDKKIKTIVVTPYPVLNLNSNYFVLKGESVKLDSYFYYGTALQFLWTPNTYLSSDSVPYPVAQPLTDITYTLLLTGLSGCSVSQSTLVKIEKLEVPNAFSPNGDGINDTWDVAFLKNYPLCSVQIFNRYGQEVFNSIGYSKPWDGKLNGQLLPLGAYYYLIKINAVTKPLSGSVLIIR